MTPNELTAYLYGDLDFVDEGEPHLHYCLTIANGFEDPVSIGAIQVLPGQSERPLVVVESDPLAESFVGASEGNRIAGYESAVLELLVPAPERIVELRHRIAFTVDDPDGARDLYADQVVTGAD